MAIFDQGDEYCEHPYKVPSSSSGLPNVHKEHMHKDALNQQVVVFYVPPLGITLFSNW